MSADGVNFFIFGLGYSASATARALGGLAESPLQIAATTRGPASGAPQGIVLHRFDGAAPATGLGTDLAAATHLLVSIPPGSEGDPVLIQHGADLEAAGRLEWIGYFSTVGVYGDHGGGWIDESAPCRPASARSRHRLAAEEAWRAFATRRGLKLAILRLAGIYGPGRSAFDKLREGTARRIVKPGQVFNRIHVEDVGRLTALAALHRLSGTFNLADDAPAPPQDVVAHAARLAGVAPPPEMAFAEAEMTAMARSFYADNKRVSNAAIKGALGVELRYPDYRAGLEAIRRADG